MAINNNDVKLFESQRLSDEEDGGGRVTGRVHILAHRERSFWPTVNAHSGRA